MKIELEDIRLGYSTLSEAVYAGVLQKNGAFWKHKQNVTNDFLQAAIQRWSGMKEIIQGDDGKKYEISIKEIK